MENTRKASPKTVANRENRVNLEKTNDGFQNLAARMGYNPGQTSNLLSEGKFSTTYSTRNRALLDSAYRGNWVVGKVIDVVAEDMTSKGITISGETEPEDISILQKKLVELGVWNALTENKKWARLYGGSIAIIQIEGQDLTSELRIETIGQGQFKGINVYDRWVCTPDMTMVIESGMDMGLPMYYSLTGQGFNVRVHHSRVVRDIGIKLPYWEAISEQMWGESIIERMEDRLMSFDTASAGAGNLINKAYLRTIRVENLRSILASGGVAEENLIKMFHYVRLLQSSEGLTIIDKMDEFETNTYNFSGLAGIINQFGEQLSGATGIPLVRLFGQSPSGFSGGESDLRNYYDMVNSLQEATMRMGLTKILHVLYKSELGVEAPSDFNYEFNTLWQLSEEQKSKIAKETGETISAALADGTIDLATAQRELKQSSHVTGIFTNITDDMIAESEEAPPEPKAESADDPNDILGTTGGNVYPIKKQAQNPFQKVADAMKRVLAIGK